MTSGSGSSSGGSNLKYFGKVVAAGGENVLTMTGIPQTARQIKIVTHCKSNSASDFLFTRLKFNNDSSNVYDWVRDIPSNGAGRNADQPGIDWSSGAKTGVPDFWSDAELTVYNYAATTGWKGFKGYGYQPANDSSNDGFMILIAGKYKNTAAINRVDLNVTGTGMFEAGSYMEIWLVDDLA